MNFQSNSTYHLPLADGPSTTHQPLLTFAALGVLTLAAAYWSFKLLQRPLVDKEGNNIPAGPRGFPILGSFPLLTQYPEVTLDRWAKKFGDLYSLWLGNQLFVIVSSPEIVKDLIVSQLTNGAVFSSRKEMFVKSKTVFVGRGITATPYNDRWRKHRRIASTWLNQRAVDSYTNTLDSEATVLIKAMYQESRGGTVPVNPQPHAGRASLNNMLSVVFGTRTSSIYHPLVGQALKISREFMNVTGPMSNLVDFIPILQHFPSPMRNRGEKLHEKLVETYGGMIKDIEHRMESGENVPDCLAKTMIESKGEEKMDDLDMAILASAFMIGGVETTAAIMQWFSALIPTYPEIQKRAHEELDRVVGRDRMPTVEDEKNLPFCHAIVKEVERCHNPFWLGTPHVASENFTRCTTTPSGTRTRTNSTPSGTSATTSPLRRAPISPTQMNVITGCSGLVEGYALE
ncbi:cytochrome P450 [Roridomyces roridus]|uniref:Cytochrome P450 n=1 Tax=Roridomyces roridus TaxID=1738132 RepID=A0AAD7CL48_9AGAR|nr:cytochrome P450 [Roridomyces roridus]